MRRTYTTFAAVLAAAAVSAAVADSVIVNEDFESYSNETELNAVWQPWDDGNPNNIPTFPDDGLLEDGTLDENNATAFPGDGFGGLQGVDHIGDSVLQYIPDLGTAGIGDAIEPTATQSIFLSGDIFDTGAAGNKRQSIGLRNTPDPDDGEAGSSNLIELGFWNADPVNTGYAYRTILFGSGSSNWAEAVFDPSLDREDDADEIVNPADIGAGWHRYTATVTPTDVTITVDLFRNGVNEATEEPGVDFEVTVPAVFAPGGFDSLRFGGPSSVTSPGSNGIGNVVYDNIFLALVDAVRGDYNGDGQVDAADYTVWRDTLGDRVAFPGDGADGNLNQIIDIGDFELWSANFGQSISPPATATIPEPASAMLLAVLPALALRGRRR
ncbi:MAG: hypothetical protein AAGJ46_06870 [Planctomycetota bacterium]